jgi:uncharacterized membrane protein
MDKIKKTFVDSDIQVFIGKQLRMGVMIACAIAIVGGIYYLCRHGLEATPKYSRFLGEPDMYTTIAGIFNGIFALKARCIIQFGVVVLLATPIFRVFFSLIAFMKEKDWMYVFITALVLGVIIFSMTTGVKL